MDNKWHRPCFDAYWGLADMEANVMFWDEIHKEYGEVEVIKDKAINFKKETEDIPIIDIPGGEAVRISKTGCNPPNDNTKLLMHHDPDGVVETADKYSTGLKQKRGNFPAFVQLIRNQFDHGGDKYATSAKGKEFTDLICEAFPGECGVDWVLGTCMKYMGRYKNFRREKDLLKVATYMYLLWLKGGFHLTVYHDEDISASGQNDRV